MTDLEAEKFKTWATTQAGKETLCATTATVFGPPPYLCVTIAGAPRKGHLAGQRFSTTFHAPMAKPKAEAEEQLTRAIRHVKARMANAIKEKKS